MEPLLVGVCVAGLAMFLVGFVWNGLTARRRALGHSEAAAVGRRGRWSFRGRTLGFAWSDEMGFAELKQGVRDGSWRRSPRLQQFLLVTIGGLSVIVGLTLLIGWWTRPAGFVVAVGLVAYVVVQMARGLARAGRG